MKKSIFLKLLIVMGLILTVVTLLSTSVLAADDEDPWSSVEVVNTGNTNATDNTGNDTTYDNTPIISEPSNNESNTDEYNSIAGETDNNSYYNNEDDNVNKNTDANASKDDLAYTGLGNTTKIIVLVAIVGAIIAVYSYKKVSDYRNL